MSDLIAIRKEDADTLSRACFEHFPIGSGGAIGEVLRAIYRLAETSFDLPANMPPATDEETA
jgi:hypothetical protein